MSDPVFTSRADCREGKWIGCPNAYGTLDRQGYQVMRCRITGEHPDDCRVTLSHAHLGGDDAIS
jgi:hypothetical protein